MIKEVQNDAWSHVMLLAHTLWDCMGNRVTAAHEGMKWLKGAARSLIAAGHEIKWTSPSGLTCRSMYTQRDRHKRVKITVFGKNFIDMGFGRV